MLNLLRCINYRASCKELQQAYERGWEDHKQAMIDIDKGCCNSKNGCAHIDDDYSCILCAIETVGDRNEH